MSQRLREEKLEGAGAVEGEGMVSKELRGDPWGNPRKPKGYNRLRNHLRKGYSL